MNSSHDPNILRRCAFSPILTAEIGVPPDSLLSGLRRDGVVIDLQAIKFYTCYFHGDASGSVSSSVTLNAKQAAAVNLRDSRSTLDCHGYFANVQHSEAATSWWQPSYIRVRERGQDPQWFGTAIPTLSTLPAIFSMHPCGSCRVGTPRPSWKCCSSLRWQGQRRGRQWPCPPCRSAVQMWIPARSTA